MSAKLTTELGAVNLCLSGIGRAPVPDIDVNDLDAAQAQSAIAEAQIDLLDNAGRGWWFNREGNWKLAPDPFNGEIQVPNNVLCIMDARGNEPLGARLTFRKGKIYDTVSHTFDLRQHGDFLYFTFIMQLDFEDMPPSARRTVAWIARRNFAFDMEGDPDKLALNNKTAEMSLGALSSQEVANMRYNMQATPCAQLFDAAASGEESGYDWRGKN